MLHQIAIFGQTGVDLFFVLSGFLITRILIATKGYDHYFSTFYCGRVLRILPLYYGFLILFYFVLPSLQSTKIAPFHSTWWWWFYLQNVPATLPALANDGPNHYWSLAVEEHFYLFWPLIVYLAPQKWLPRLCWGVILAAVVSRLFFIYQLHVSVFWFTTCRMDALAAGALLACCEAKKSIQAKAMTFLGIALCLPPLGMLLWWRFRTFGAWADLKELFKYSSFAAFYVSIIGLTVFYRESRLVKALFTNRPLVFSGKISYGLYVYHLMCFGLMANALSPKEYPILCLIASFGAVILVSWLSFVLFESRFLALKRFVSYNKSLVNGQAKEDAAVSVK